MAAPDRPRSVPRGYRPLDGSERRPTKSARRLGPADPAEVLRVTIVVRRRLDGEPLPDHDYFLRVPPAERPRMSDEEFAAAYGASPADLNAVTTFVTSHGLAVLDTNAASRTVEVQGTVAQMNAAFGVDLGRYRHQVPVGRGRETQTETYRGRDGSIYIPAALAQVIVGIFGLDNRRVGRRNGAEPPNTNTVSVPTVASLYNYPTNSAAGQTIGIFSLTGYAASDITSYFGSLPAGHPAPTVTDIPLNGATNTGSDPFGETTQDIQIAAAFAPSAAVNVYITTPDQAGWVAAINRVAHPLATDSAPSVLSSSWGVADGDDTAGLADQGVTIAFVQAVSAAFQDAAIQGITVCIASGDRGTDSAVGDRKAHVQYPASDPWVLAVGGTTIGNINGSNFDEYVWNDPNSDNWGTTGGGVSAYFAVPSYQAAIGVPASLNDATQHGRGVPDVAGNANINSGYSGLVLGGSSNVGNGTSASAPQWAGLIAVLNAALGTNLGFINPALYALRGAGLRDIVPGAGPGDNANNGAPGYPAGAGWDACTGWGSPNGQALLDALRTIYTRNLYFVVDKSTFGLDEVTDVIMTAGGLYSSAFWLVLEGFSISQLGSTLPTLSGAFWGLTGVTIFPDGSGPQYQFPGDLYTPQRIRIPYDIIFGSAALTADFPATGGMPNEDPLIASITLAGSTLTAAALFELVAGADPYFTNIDPITRQDFYLSQDLRVFSAAAGDTPVPGAPALTSDPYASIQALLGYLNSTPAYTNPGPDPLNALPGQTGYETGDSSVTPLNGAGNRNFNYAIGRVRLQGAAPSGAAPSTAPRVRVFFRLFVTQSCDTDFQPLTTYKSEMGTGADAGHPVRPQPSGSGLTDPSGNSLQTVPFFGTDSAGTHDYDGTVTNGNIRDLVIPSGRDKLWAYFGCFLDVYDSSNNALYPGTHHCIVAEIAYNDAPIVNSGGVTENPENSDKLAQRNLQITASGNPTYPDTHYIPQAFDTRPSPSPLGAGQLLDYPDELMIDWGNVPVASTASVFWPDASADDVLALATRIYGHHPFARVDDHTVSCLTTAGVTYLPIPYGASNLAGLFTVELPAGISVGQEFKAKIRRIATRRAGEEYGGRVVRTRQLDSAFRDLGTDEGAKGQLTINWRYITGTFGLTIPVVRDGVLLAEDENTYAVLRWRLGRFSAAYRWRPVVDRYLAYLARRIDGAGGDAGSIQPSEWGHLPRTHPGTRGQEGDGAGSVYERGLERSGKVSAVVYDVFGDFEGFWLESLDGRFRYHASEHKIEDLARHAWLERIVVSVYASQRDPVRPTAIVYRRAPRHLASGTLERPD
jgi:hypothetical protein